MRILTLCSHPQLRHYISTADPDRIYVISARTVFAIHVSTCKVEAIALIPFSPRCLTAGYGWIGLGGADNGECAFIKLGDYGMRAPVTAGPRPADVDSALPVDLEGAARASSPWADDASSLSRRAALVEVQLHKFGGAIVNSITVHRLPGDNKGLADEDVMVLRYDGFPLTETILGMLTRLSSLKQQRQDRHHLFFNPVKSSQSYPPSEVYELCDNISGFDRPCGCW